jgi:hypothetical protein
MIDKIYKKLNSRKSLFTILASILSIFLLVDFATAGGNFAKVVRNRDLDNSFRNYEVMQDYNYYTTGGYDRPNAILLVHKDYKLENPGNLWVTIPSVGYNQKRKWISVISSEQDSNRSGYYYASYILDQNGKKVGVWYSIETHGVVKFLDGNRILAYTPMLNRNSILGGVDY